MLLLLIFFSLIQFDVSEGADFVEVSASDVAASATASATTSVVAAESVS